MYLADSFSPSDSIFATRAVPGLIITTRVALGRWQLGIAALALACRLMRLNYAAAASLSLVGLIVIIQVLLSWKPLKVRHQPLLWVLYFGYMALGLGLLSMRPIWWAGCGVQRGRRT